MREKGITYFEQAIEHDPAYALAYTGLADSYILMARFQLLPPRDAFPRARAAAAKALEIDETLAEAETSLALVKFLFDWDWPGAERGFKRALELNARDANTTPAQRVDGTGQKPIYLPYSIAIVYTGLGEKDQALAWLDAVSGQPCTSGMEISQY